MSKTDRICDECGKKQVRKFLEAGHTRMFFCINCTKQYIEFVKKPIKCEHFFIDGLCMNCGYNKLVKYV